jgi:hypothetical protein
VRWRAKGLVQKVLSVAPGGRWMNDRLQRSIGSFSRFESESEAKIEDFFLMTGQLGDAGVPIAGTRFLEIGSGWYPTLPIGLYLGGARRVMTFDLVQSTRSPRSRRCLRATSNSDDNDSNGASHKASRSARRAST